MKVFISHAHTDEPLVKKVAVGLKEAGLEVWDDTREIMPGDNWADKVAQALRESETMVVLLTPDALRSSWVRRDVEYALGEQG
jgi:TIR domain